MSAQTPMTPIWKRSGRRLHVGWYRHEPRTVIHGSRDWGGRYGPDGRLSLGIGFQVGAGGHVLEVIVWPGRKILLPSERLQVVKSRRSA